MNGMGWDVSICIDVAFADTMDDQAAEIEDMINDIDLDQNGTLDLDGTPEISLCTFQGRILIENLVESQISLFSHVTSNMYHLRIHQDDDHGRQARQLRGGDAQCLQGL